MGRTYRELDDRLIGFITAQPLFFVASAPERGGGHVNVSPKGYADTFAVLGPRAVAYLDLTGSGAETVAHVRENGRLTLMFCSFSGQPKIVRLYGAGQVVAPHQDWWEELSGRFGARAGARAVVVLSIERIADSCGYAVPFMEYAGDRPLLEDSHRRKGPQQLAQYRAERNAASIDGLAALPVAPGGTR